MDSLVTDSDPAYIAYKAGDPNYFLSAASAYVRSYCGWHISPSRSETDVKRRIGSFGKIILPTLHLVSVEKLVVDDAVVDPGDYHWWPNGVVELKNRYRRDGYCLIDYTHGYAVVPDAVQSVVMELANTAQSLGGGTGVKGVTTPGYSITYGESGLELSPSQRDALAAYRITLGGAV